MTDKATRIESDFIGNLDIPALALYGIHSQRAKENFKTNEAFHLEWFKACGTVKKACYATVSRFIKAAQTEYSQSLNSLNLPSQEILALLISSSEELALGLHYGEFIVPAVQGGAGTSINLNINEIISNRALQLSGNKPGDYNIIDPIETANIYQSTNDVIPTALTVATMNLLNKLELQINRSRQETEKLEKRYRSSLRIAYTQMEEAVPSTYGQLFSNYSDALSRDWWRVSKAFERIKQVNLGGGAVGTGISIPRYYIMEVVNELRKITTLPLAQAENLCDRTSNMDSYLEVHAILKAHAVNLMKIANDLRLLASGVNENPELKIPAMQTGSSIMPGKVNPVIPEYIISCSREVFRNDQLITDMAADSLLDLNAYLPSLGNALLKSLDLLISANASLSEKLLSGVEIDETLASKRLFHSPAITTALSPYVGYHKAAELATYMNKNKVDIFAANKTLALISDSKLEKLMQAGELLKKGFSLKDISADD